jgi:hypothetical protein
MMLDFQYYFKSAGIRIIVIQANIATYLTEEELFNKMLQFTHSTGDVVTAYIPPCPEPFSTVPGPLVTHELYAREVQKMSAHVPVSLDTLYSFGSTA